MAKARYIMIGGFLGAGKTTAVLKLAEYLTGQGLRVGLITNDQSTGLVDTAMLGAHGFDVAEVAGGCFCCRFNSLVEASEKLSEQSRPDVFIAEPVGSCTDLKATVSFPLRRIYGNDFTVAPLSVMVDPVRALRILGVEPGKPFSQKVLYVYGKQLEEAEIVVVNKVDLLSPERLAALRDTLRRAYPKAEVIEVSARHRTGLQQWFDRIASAELQAGPAMQVDYDLYAEGEALLGWLNCTAKLSASTSIDGNALVQDLARRIQARLADAGQEIAHLKMTLAPDEGNDLAVLNLVRNDHAPELSHQLQEELASGELIVNLRAEADPDVLRQVVEQSLAHAASAARVNLNVDHLEHFRPGRPQPTHRLASV